MDTRELLESISDVLKEYAATQQDREAYYLYKLADTIDTAIEESEDKQNASSFWN